MITQKWVNCTNCGNSFSLPAGEQFDDGSVYYRDRLVCMYDKNNKRIVQDNGHCSEHNFVHSTK